MDIKNSIERFIEINSGITQNDKVAIIYNPKRPQLSRELFSFLYGKRIYAQLCNEYQFDWQNEDRIISDFSKFTAILSNTEITLFHNKAFNKLTKKGVKFISLTGANVETFTNKVAEADFRGLSEKVINLAEIISQGKQIKIESASGTHIVGNISNRKANAETGLNSIKNPSVFPDIEVNTSIIENECNGHLIIDLSMTKFGILKSPLKLTIKGGKIEYIEGLQAKEIRNWISSFKDENILQVAEFGFGLNPKAEIVGNIIEDESKLGTAHIGFGNNIFMGGRNVAVTHFDMVFDNPKVFLDERLIINGNKILV